MVEQEDGVSGCGEEDSRHSNGDDCSADPDSVSPRRSSAEECSDSEVSSHGSWEDQFGDSERRAWEESESRAFKRRKTSKGDKATAASEKAKEDKAELKKLRTTHEKLLKLHDALGKKHALLKMQVAETRKSNARDIKRLKDDHKDEIRKLKDGHKKYIADVKKDCNHDNDFALEYQKMAGPVCAVPAASAGRVPTPTPIHADVRWDVSFGPASTHGINERLTSTTAAYPQQCK